MNPPPRSEECHPWHDPRYPPEFLHRLRGPDGPEVGPAALVHHPGGGVGRGEAEKVLEGSPRGSVHNVFLNKGVGIDMGQIRTLSKVFKKLQTVSNGVTL